jgi:hypothetical protein
VSEQTLTHIRTPDNTQNFCGGKNGGSISLRHYIEQPEHARSLLLCKVCVEGKD